MTIQVHVFIRYGVKMDRLPEITLKLPHADEAHYVRELVEGALAQHFHKCKPPCQFCKPSFYHASTFLKFARRERIGLGVGSNVCRWWLSED